MFFFSTVLNIDNYVGNSKNRGSSSKNNMTNTSEEAQFDVIARRLDTINFRNEIEKTREYSERIQHLYQGSFNPFVFTTSCFWGQMFLCKTQRTDPRKKHQQRNYVVAWMTFRFSFSLFKSVIIYVMGTKHYPKSYQYFEYGQ